MGAKLKHQALKYNNGFDINTCIWLLTRECAIKPVRAGKGFETEMAVVNCFVQSRPSVPDQFMIPVDFPDPM